MNGQAHIPAIRLLIAGVYSLILLAGIAFPIFIALGDTLEGVIPVVLCVFTLVILTPVIVGGSKRDRILALMLSVFPAVLLLSIVVFTKTFGR